MDEISVPAAGDIERWLSHMASDPRTTRVLLQARQDLAGAAPEVGQAIAASAASVLEYVGVVDPPWPAPTLLGAEHGLAGQMADALAILCCVPALLDFHAAHGVPREQTWAVLADLPRQVRLYRAVHGTDGFKEHHWLQVHLRGLLYDFGRPQVERRKTIVVPVMQEALAAAGADLAGDAVLLNTHIADTGPMDPAACDESFARALRELPGWFPGERYTAFTCLSWLLDPQLGEYLAPESNIMRFQRRFELVGPGFPATESTMTYIFKRAGQVDLDRLPQRTSLERAFVKHVRAGSQWEARAGWFPADAVRR